MGPEIPIFHLSGKNARYGQGHESSRLEGVAFCDLNPYAYGYGDVGTHHPRHILTRESTRKDKYLVVHPLRHFCMEILYGGARLHPFILKA